MHLPTILLVGAMVLAAPAGYLAVQEGPAATPMLVRASTTSISSAEPSEAAAGETGFLRYRVHHDGKPLAATLRIVGDDGVVLEEEVELASGVDTTIETEVPVGAYAGEIEASDSFLFVPLFSVSGNTGSIDLAECPGRAADILFQTHDYDSRQGVVVLGAQCMPGPERHVGLQRIGVGTVTPYPTCPTSCTVGYQFLSEGAVEFEVDEPAGAIRVSAAWDPDLPSLDGLKVWLVRRDACGEGCGEVVASAELDDEVRFEHLDPAPGEYGLAAYLDGSAGAKVDEYVWLMATVVPL